MVICFLWVSLTSYTKVHPSLLWFDQGRRNWKVLVEEGSQRFKTFLCAKYRRYLELLIQAKSASELRYASFLNCYKHSYLAVSSAAPRNKSHRTRAKPCFTAWSTNSPHPWLNQITSIFCFRWNFSRCRATLPLHAPVTCIPILRTQSVRINTSRSCMSTLMDLPRFQLLCALPNLWQIFSNFHVRVNLTIIALVCSAVTSVSIPLLITKSTVL